MKVVKVCDTSTNDLVIHSCVKYNMIMSMDKNCGPKTKSCQKLFKFDHETQGPLRIAQDARDKSSGTCKLTRKGRRTK